MAKIKIVRKSLIVLITGYRYLISPLLGQRCRFYPSCSEYAQDAIEYYGVVRGLLKASKRLLSCHPWHRGGYDPIPETIAKLKLTNTEL